MQLSEWWSNMREVAQILNVLGLPIVITYFLYNRRKLKNYNQGEELKLRESEAMMPDRLKTSSILSLEAEWLAYKQTSDSKFAVMQETIDHLKAELAEARRELAEKERMIDAMQEQLSSVRSQMRQLQTKVDDLQRQLNRARTNNRKDRS